MSAGRLPITDFRISPEDINSMEPISFDGSVTVVNNEDTAENAFNVLFAEKMIGFDTESRPSFIKGRHYPVSIVQLATLNQAFIFQIKYTGFLDGLSDLLSSAEIYKVGVGVDDDIRRLKELRVFNPASFIDLSAMARKKGLQQSGAKALTARYLGKKLVKSAQKTNWAKQELTQRQIQYAATDAWICLHILEPLQRDNTDYFSMAKKESEELD